jgi:hypothetical protein
MPFGAGRGGHSDPCLRTAHLRVEAARGDGAGRCGCQGPVWHVSKHGHSAQIRAGASGVAHVTRTVWHCGSI